MENELKIGEWVSAFEGIGQVVSTHDFYIEEYSPEITEGKKVGELQVTLCVYKMLCDFEGKIRKRSLILNCNANMCRPLSSVSKTMLDDIKNKNLEEYEMYLNYKNKLTLGRSIDIWLDLTEMNLEELHAKISSINEELTKPFTYIDFLNKLNLYGIDINPVRSSDSLGWKNFVISLYNKDFLTKDKRALFSEVKSIVNRNYFSNS